MPRPHKRLIKQACQLLAPACGAKRRFIDPVDVASY